MNELAKLYSDMLNPVAITALLEYKNIWLRNNFKYRADKEMREIIKEEIEKVRALNTLNNN